MDRLIDKYSAWGYCRGHIILWDKPKRQWVWCDNLKIVDDIRSCKRCGCSPTKEGHDACLGYIEGITSACCGHGVSEPILMKA